MKRVMKTHRLLRYGTSKLAIIHGNLAAAEAKLETQIRDEKLQILQALQLQGKPRPE